MRRTPCGCNLMQEPPTAYKLPSHVIARAPRARGNLVQESPTAYKLPSHVIARPQRGRGNLMQESPTAYKLPSHVIARPQRGRGNLMQELPTAYKPIRPYRLPLTRSARRGAPPYDRRTHPRRRGRRPRRPACRNPIMHKPILLFPAHKSVISKFKIRRKLFTIHFSLFTKNSPLRPFPIEGEVFCMIYLTSRIPSPWSRG